MLKFLTSIGHKKIRS